MGAIEIPDDLLLIAGRQFRYCDFDKVAKKNPEGLYHRPLQTKDKKDCNLWSSQCRMDPTKHLPCFDVDMPPETGLLPGILKELYGTVGVCISVLFSEGDHALTWVPSTTEDHFHVYIDYPYRWEDYLGKLRSLSRMAVAPWGSLRYIVEPNYVWYSQEHGASHVRMPHVKKVFTPRQTN